MAELILVCEDDALTALRLELTLSALGYEVACAPDSEQAVQLALQLRPHVILMDVNMPGRGGISALRKIMREAPTAVLMLTGYADPETVRRALDAGASGYLVKPFRDEQLAPAISVAHSRLQKLMQVRLSASTAATEADREVKEGLRRVAELGQALQEERALARALAESFHGPIPVGISGVGIETVYAPATAAELVGGDYFDFILLDDHRVGIVIADVCGKGLPAAALTAVSRHMLRAYALEDPSPETVLRRLNRALYSHVSDECAFITLVYGVLDLASFDFVYANAGHPSPIVCGPDGCKCIPLLATGGLLGAEPDWEWASAEVRIPPGGALTLFTDGIIEARRGQDMFGPARVEKALCELLSEPSADLAIGLKERVCDFAGSGLKDDVAIVVVRRPALLERQRSAAGAV